MFDEFFMNPGERLVRLNANGGSWDNNIKEKDNFINVASLAGLSTGLPTKDGMQVTGWNTKPDGSGNDAATLGSKLENGSVLYAQWEKATGKPTEALISCGKQKCSVAVRYADAPGKWREMNVNATYPLAWGGSPIPGVQLNGDGYNPSNSCDPILGRCFYVSLTEAPPSTTGYIAQAPTTGAPNGLSSIGFAAIGVALAAIGLSLRKQRA